MSPAGEALGSAASADPSPDASPAAEQAGDEQRAGADADAGGGAPDCDMGWVIRGPPSFVPRGGREAAAPMAGRHEPSRARPLRPARDVLRVWAAR